MRVAFPVRVFLSYLLVLMVGALPTFVYLELTFEKRLLRYETNHLLLRARHLANRLAQSPSESRLAWVQSYAPLQEERITYIGADGKVLFDSAVRDISTLENHSQRPEIRLARGEPSHRLAFAPKLVGVGVARRISKTTHRDTLYIAIRLSSMSGVPSEFIRLALPIGPIKALKIGLLQAFRNSLAGAISAALLLSLLSAFLFMRPLQRLIETARGLVRGDYSMPTQHFTNDEIGDVARSLQQLAVELRRRLAMAEASEALLVQLVQIDPTPLVVFDQERRVRAINGTARQLFETGREDAEEIFARWLHSRQFQLLREDLLKTEAPQDVKIDIEEEDRILRRLSGTLHLLQHPSGTTFGVFLGKVGVLESLSFLPSAADVRAKELRHILKSAQQRASSALERAKVKVKYTSEFLDVRLADVQERLVLALTLLFEGLAGERTPGSRLTLHVSDEPLHIILSLDDKAPQHIEDLIQLILKPLGAEFEASSGGYKLRCPKA